MQSQRNCSIGQPIPMLQMTRFLHAVRERRPRRPFNNGLRHDRLIADARDLPKPVRTEIEKFFVATDKLEDKHLKFLDWKGPKTGER